MKRTDRWRFPFVLGEEATTGWSESHHGTFSVPSTGNTADDDDAVGPIVPAHRANLEEINRTMAAPVIDMLRRAEPGQTFRLAMYGLSTSSPEFKELVNTLKRGVKLRVVLYKKYNNKAIDELKRLRDEPDTDVDIRVLSSRVMHEKFGVVDDDVFNGSANWSTSSINKHSEDRFLFRNQPDLANRFVEEFARLWERGNPA